ncbi:MAG: IS5 family transposase [Rhodospirillales bacterium]|nr:IS5 family transposase [Rhodospirillales bacterium]
MEKQPELFDYQRRMEILSAKRDPLERLNAIDWEIFRPILGQVRRKEPGSAGRNPFDEVVKFKILILQRLYDLSDEQAEFQINDRLSFMRFLGLDFHDKVPDESTIRFFREQLVGLKLMRPIFRKFLRHLKDLGLIFRKGSLIDASIVEVPRQRNSREENRIVKDGGIPPEWPENQARMAQKDVDARWTKKNGVSYFGYKNHVRVDRKGKFVTEYTVTSASVHDSRAARAVLEGHSGEDGPVHGDSAYDTPEIRSLLERRGVRHRFCQKGYRNKPLSEKQKRRNHGISIVRARVEHVFGDIEKFGGDFIRTIGMARAEFQMGLTNLVYNMRRFVFVYG